MNWQRTLYSLLWYPLLPIVLLRLWLRGSKNLAYRQRWPERLGFIKPPKNEKPIICLHAVSVGEVMAARPLIERLLIELSEYQLWITTTTPTGSDTVQRLFGEKVTHSYLPYDLSGAVRRFLTRTRPVLLLVVETELWPNLYACCARRAIPLLLINARLSGRSVRRYQKIGGLVADTLRHVSCVMARSEQDAERFRLLGAAAERVQVAGNIKFDIAPSSEVKQLGLETRNRFGQRPVWCAGSTHRGEDDILLTVHARLVQTFPDLLLILVPRHPERFGEVAELCAASGLSWTRRTAQLPDSNHSVLLGDSMGELLLWYAASDLAFIGGSLVPVGGHNPLEAAVFGIPVLSGQYVHNFPDLYPPLVSVQSAQLVDSVDMLEEAVRDWLHDADKRKNCGEAGKRFLQENRGVVARLMSKIKACL